MEDILNTVIYEIEDIQTRAGTRLPHRIVETKAAFRAPAVPLTPSIARKRSASMARDMPEKLGKVRKFTQDTPEPSARASKDVAGVPETEMNRILDELVEGSGLSKKPRKRAKRRKRKQKTPKKRGKTPKKQVSRPKTGLQKWHSQRNAPRRMRL